MLAVLLWAVYAINIATPGLRDRFGQIKGADFLNFYTLGAAAVEHRPQALYDGAALAEIELRRVPQAAGNYFPPAYGPQVAVAMAPFAKLPYPAAAALWMLLSAVAYGSCGYAVWRVCPNLRNHGHTVAWLAAGFPGFFALFTFGQTSWVALIAFTLAYFALRQRREFLAGACLGVVAYKPQLAVVAGLVLLASALAPAQDRAFLVSRWRSIAGALVTLVAQAAVAWLYFGREALIAYFNNFRHVVEAPGGLKPVLYLMHSLGPFWELLVPRHGVAVALYCASALAAGILVLRSWRPNADVDLANNSLEMRYAILLIGTVVASPFLTIYDLVIAAPALLFIAEWLLAHPEHPYFGRVQWALYLSYALPLFGPLARYTRVQVSVMVLAALLIWLTSIASRSGITLQPKIMAATFKRSYSG
jgi:hypothetical protein